eukprot:COSAG01_NODE_27060_length_695_cov_4.102349_1_plen_35_part_10
MHNDGRARCGRRHDDDEAFALVRIQPIRLRCRGTA